MKSAEVAIPRPPRFSYAHALHHVTLRCNNREFLFTEPTFALFPPLLAEARARFPLALYNYCLMTNHVHLLFRVGRDDTLSKAMHWPLYLELGADAPSRYRRYEALLAEEASREPVGLAESYFVGSRRFVGRMERRFGFGTGRGRRLTRRVLAGGVILSGPSHGGSRRPK